jgi:TM2 domain-containing membrane protein YozV
MYCSYHTTTAAKVQCASCNRGLCTSCDHRIKGFPYCQDCIVTGIQSLQHRNTQYHYYQANDQRKGSSGKALLAALCAFIPGAGAIYNRQNLKAFVHFISIIGLFQLASLHILGGLFWFGGLLLYFYSIVDAYRTARAVGEGASAAENEERFKRSLIKRAPAIGVGLIIAGLLVFLQLLRPFGQFVSLSRLAPVALIILGGYLLTRYFKQSRDGRPQETERQAFYLVSGDYSGRDGQRVNESSRFGNYR